MKTHSVPCTDKEQFGSYNEGSSTRVWCAVGPYCPSEAESPMLDILKVPYTQTGNPNFV